MKLGGSRGADLHPPARMSARVIATPADRDAAAWTNGGSGRPADNQFVNRLELPFSPPRGTMKRAISDRVLGVARSLLLLVMLVGELLFLPPSGGAETPSGAEPAGVLAVTGALVLADSAVVEPSSCSCSLFDGASKYGCGQASVTLAVPLAIAFQAASRRITVPPRLAYAGHQHQLDPPPPKTS